MYTLSSSILTLLNMIVWNRGVSPYGRVIDGVFLYEDSMPFWQILILSKFATKSLSPIASRHDFLIALRFIRMNKRSLPLRGQYTFSTLVYRCTPLIGVPPRKHGSLNGGTMITCSVRHNFLVKICTTLPRTVVLRLSIPPSKINEITSRLFSCGRWRNREYTFGHEYFSAEKSLDPDSARQPPSFDSSIATQKNHSEK